MSDKAIPVKVALRIRPLNQRERNDACSKCLRTISNEPRIIIGKDKPFTFDYVFAQNTPQLDVYVASVQPLLDALFKGYNATVLAYGQTSSGKTFTMGSDYAALSSAMASVSNVDIQTSSILNMNDLDQVGVIPRVRPVHAH
ncbi:chromosome-associated kinesin KIF4A [Brachionus plicatilis]|uniref:Chromosome-associated kinesin KIF4A n=1 Tax=Brachionus plicatilis TaxID=10195 RepID=A0A3M7S0D8_BRAPC|nr:chromosome-associated kinesin KIF4A [Brachionus plicatilis]